jgi:RNA polymerase sigma-70 factor (ECF subfamily)
MREVLCSTAPVMADQRASGAEKRRLFEQHVLPHLDLLYAAAMRLVRNADDAGDLVQETILRGYRFFHQFTPGTNCRAWLLTILYNNFRTGYRRRSQEQPAASAQDFARQSDVRGLADDPADSNPETIVGERRVSREVSSALDALPEDFRVALLMVDMEDLSYQEVSGVLSIPVGTVKSRVSRGRAMLRETLKGYARERGIIRS